MAYTAAVARSVNAEDARELVWKRIGYACRYGHTGLEVMHLPSEHLGELLYALGKIVEEENEASKRR